MLFRSFPGRIFFELLFSVVLIGLPGVGWAQEQSAAPIKIATFRVDATPPVGSAMAYDPVKRHGELPLSCRGIVILTDDLPIVLCAVDWIGIANEGHDAFRDGLAAAAGTTRDRVAVHSLHQHDAPGCDFTAERIIRELGIANYGRYEGTFHRQVIKRAAEAIKFAIPVAQPATHFGWGAVKVDKVASNRRILGPDGRVAAMRWTASRDPRLRAEPVGVIDPEVSVLTFWNDEQPIAGLSFYACHPQSYYRTGVPSPDFPGIARFIRSQDVSSALHVHFNGAGGNIGAGKYNDGAESNRMQLAIRLAAGMRQAFSQSDRKSFTEVGWETVAVQLPPARHLKKTELIEALKTEPPQGYIAKADQLAWLQRCEAGHAIDIGCLKIGKSRLMFMPGELFVEYQLAAKEMRPDLQIAMAAYGDYGPGYIGTEQAYTEGGYETSARASNVAPTAEKILTKAMEQLLTAGVDQTEPKDLSPDSKPLPPREAIDSFEVTEGFEMQLVASEPDVQEPIVICYDERGQMYVAEYLKFPAQDGKSSGPDGRIRRLRDKDQDGYYEQSVVFADGMAWPSGICCWKGGVFVIASPDLWYLKDTTGDGVADVRKKVFSGFGFSNEEGTANNLFWGLDNWIYGAGSNSGGQIRRADEEAVKSISIRGQDFRFHPETYEFEAISGSEQFGNTFDDWGNRFICQNSKPAVHMVLPARYLRRNPYLSVSSVRKDIWTGNQIFRKSLPEAWRVARTNIRLSQDRRWAAPFVAHDVFTACSGVTIYRGDACPESLQGDLFVGDVQGNLVHRRKLEPDGVSFQARRVEQETEFVRSSDNWFRPVNFANAPDGTLHVVDMYRELIETPDSLPPEVLATVDLQNGHQFGRIYRIVPVGFENPAPPKLDSANILELVQQLESPNGWYRDTASRLLFERQDRKAIPALRKLLKQAQSDVTRLHALYAIQGLGNLQPEDVFAVLNSPTPSLRKHGVRLAESLISQRGSSRRTTNLSESEDQRSHTNQLLLQNVAALASDPSALVRFQVALSLGEFERELVARALTTIVRQDFADRWIRAAVLSSSFQLGSQLLDSLLQDTDFCRQRDAQPVLHQLAMIVGGRNVDTEVTSLLDRMGSKPDDLSKSLQQTVLLGLAEGLRQSGSALHKFIGDSTSSAAMVKGLVDRARQTMESDESSIKQKIHAVEDLTHSDFHGVRESFSVAISTRQTHELQLAAIRALGRFEDEQVADFLIGECAQLSPAIRAEAVETLLSRHTWTERLIDAVELAKLPPGLIAPHQKTRLNEHEVASIRAVAQRVFGQAQSDRNTILDRYAGALAQTGNEQRGHALFKKNCATCHKVHGQGHEVGPDLATTQNQSPQSLLIEILDPNRNVQANYTNYFIELSDGRIASGMIIAELPGSITIRRAEKVEETILRQNIEQIRSAGKSLMPTGLEESLSEQDVSDLIAFLVGLGRKR